MKIKLKKQSFLYHLSDNDNINVFEPRTFYHNKDFSTSGSSPFKGSIQNNLVFAVDDQYKTFYALPRDTKRIMLDICPQYKMLFVDKKEKHELQNFSWTEYKFDLKNFKKLPGGKEYITTNSIKPISKTKYKNCINYIDKSNFDLIFAEDIDKLYDFFKQNNIIIDSEGF